MSRSIAATRTRSPCSTRLWLEARRLGRSYVGTEHLLVALVRHRDMLPDPVSALLPGDVDALTATLEGLLGGPPPRDAELL